MTFETAYIKSFGKLTNLSLSLAEGVNIIEGDNESGKSTICEFIRFIFYGLPSKIGEKLRFISWDTSLASGYLVINDNGNRYRIEREVVCATSAEGKHSFREKCAIYDAETNLICFKGQTPGDVFFGVSASVFESTVYIRQTANTKIGGSALGEEAENILFSGNESINTGKAMAKLESARVFLLHKNHRGGKIAELETERDAVDKKLESAKKAGGDIIYLEGTHRQIAEKKEESEVRLAALRAELDEYERYTVKKAYLRRKAEKARLTETEENIEKLKVPKEHGGLHIADSAYIAKLEKKQNELELAMSRYADAEKELADANAKISSMSEKLAIFERFQTSGKRDELVADMDSKCKKMKNCRVIGIILSIVAVLSIAAAAFLRTLTELPESLKYIAVICGLLFAAIAVYFFFMKRTDYDRDIKTQCMQFNCQNYAEFKELVRAASEDEAYMLFITSSRDEKTDKFNSTSEDLEAVSAEILGILREGRFEISGNTSASLTEAIEKCRETRTEITKLETTATELRNRIDLIEIDLAKHTKEYLQTACFSEYNEEAMEAFNLAAKKRDHEFLTGAIASQTERMHQIDVELSALRAVNLDPTTLAEEKAVLDEEIETLSKKWSAYMLAIETMEAASGKLREGLSPKIAKNAGKLMNMMTEGKYSEFGVDTNFSLSFSDGASMREADYLSAGTGDLAYICLRIALIELLYKKSIPPFIFDESFVRMDDARMKKVLMLMHKYAERDFQSILLTCHSRERDTMSEIGSYHHLVI